MRNVRRVGKQGGDAGNPILGRGSKDIRYLGDLEGEDRPISF